MITPTMQSAGLITTTLMKSMIEETEERRVEDEKKARKQTDTDEMLKAKLSASTSHEALNDKINAHFFGALKSEGDAMAQLISRVTGALGLEQGADESDVDFGTRIEDNLVLMETIGKKEANLSLDEQKITLKRFMVSVADVNAVIDGTAENPSENAKMLARFAQQTGISQAEGETDLAYSKRFGETLASLRKSLPENTAALEKSTGLRDLGITIEQVVAAIKRPYGEEAKIIKEILDDKASEDKMLTADTQKALQRLEDVADPKSKAELQLEKTDASDPTRVEDAETRKEREEDIRARDAADKLEDVQKVQETIATVNDALVRQAPKDGGAASEPATGDAPAPHPEMDLGDLLQTLAAGAEMAKVEEETEATAPEEPRLEAIDTEAGKTQASQEAKTETDQAVLVARSSQGDAAQPEGSAADAGEIVPVSTDENGIYEILKRKSEETQVAA